MLRLEKYVSFAAVFFVFALFAFGTCQGVHAAKSSGSTKDAKPSKPGKVTISNLTSGTSMTEGEITVKWGKISCAGYQLAYADNKDFKSGKTCALKGSGSITKQLTCLNEGSTYWVRVRAYNTSGSSTVYGAWSGSKSITAHAHEFEASTLKEASCGVAGTLRYSCKGCGYSYDIRLTPLKHEYRSKVTSKPSCKDKGVTTFTCIRCGDSYVEHIPKISEHKPKKKGSDTVCKVCGKTLSKGSNASTKDKPKKKAKASGKSKGTKQEGKKKQVKKKQAKPAKTKLVETKPAKDKSVKTKPSQDEKAQPKSGKKTEPGKKAKAGGKSKKLSRKERTSLARNAAVSWAINIANDNSFHYGRSSWAHHHGCYFCGTNQRANSPKRRAGASAAACARTYCCNPFLTAAYRHGAGAKEVDCRFASKRINLANDSNRALNNKKAFSRITKPKNVKSLKKGDILLTPTHAMLYAGDGKVVHAAHHDNGKQGKYWNSSITYGKIDKNQWKRVSKIYRYKGTGKF